MVMGIAINQAQHIWAGGGPGHGVLKLIRFQISKFSSFKLYLHCIRLSPAILQTRKTRKPFEKNTQRDYCLSNLLTLPGFFIS